MKERTLLSRESGVSETVGFLLVFGIVVTGIAMVTLYGYPALMQEQQNANVRNMERTLIILQNDLKSLAYKNVPYKETSLQVAGGTLSVQKGSVANTNLTVSWPGNSYTFYPGEIHFESQDAMVSLALENGAVIYTDWTSPNGSAMLAEPRWFYDEPTNTFVMSIINLTSTENLYQTGIGTVRMALTDTSQWGPYDVTGQNVAIKYQGNIQSNYNVAWRNYFNSYALKMKAIDTSSNLETTYELPLTAKTLIIKTYNVTILSL
jgi:hypothetical protein